MGNALQSACHWSGASLATDRKLAATPLNDALLAKIADFVIEFDSSYGSQASFVFKRPLVWKTDIDVTQLVAHGFLERGDEIVSEMTNVIGEPVTVISPNDHGSYDVHVSNFTFLERLLLIASEHQLAEVRRCVEANTDIMGNIIGDKFSAVNSGRNMANVMEELIHESTAGDDKQEYMATLKMFLTLKQFEEELLLLAVKQMTITQVDNVPSAFNVVPEPETVAIPSEHDTADVEPVLIAPTTLRSVDDLDLDHPADVPVASQPDAFSADVAQPRPSQIQATSRRSIPEDVERTEGLRTGKDTSVASLHPAGSGKLLTECSDVTVTGSSTHNAPGYYGADKFEGHRTEKGYFGKPTGTGRRRKICEQAGTQFPDVVTGGSLSDVHEGYFGSEKPEEPRPEVGYYGLTQSTYNARHPAAAQRDGAQRDGAQSDDAPRDGTQQGRTRTEPPGYFGAEKFEGLRTEKGYFGMSAYSLEAIQTAGWDGPPGYFGADSFEGQRAECGYYGPLSSGEVCDWAYYPPGEDDAPGYFGAEKFEGRRTTTGYFGPDAHDYQAAHSAGSVRSLTSAAGGDMGDDEEYEEDFERTETSQSSLSKLDALERTESGRRMKPVKSQQSKLTVLKVGAGGDAGTGSKQLLQTRHKVKDSNQYRDHKAERKKSAVEVWLDESSSDGDLPEDSEDENSDVRYGGQLPDVDHWLIQKLIRYIKAGDQAATIISLCALQDLNLYQDKVQMSIVDVGGLEVLVNLLESGVTKSTVGALKVLRVMTTSKKVCETMKQFGGVQSLVALLHDVDREVQGLAAEVISRVSRLEPARKIVRVHNGIARLVALLDIPPSYLILLRQSAAPKATTTPDGIPTTGRKSFASRWPGELPLPLETRAPKNWRDYVTGARSAANALCSLAVSRRNRLAMRNEGIIPVLARLFNTDCSHLLIPIVGIVNNFAKENIYRSAILSEGMVYDLVRTCKIEHIELQKHSAFAIFQCAEDQQMRDLVRQYGGLSPLVSNIANPASPADLLLACTGAIWKLSLSPENVTALQKLNIIPLLVGLLHDQPERVVSYVAGTLTELTRVAANRELFYTAGGVPALLNYQMATDAQLIVAVNNTIANCALHPPSLAIIDSLDGLRLLWSVLRHPSPEAQASAAWAISPCVENIKDSAELIRSLAGGLELLVKRLNSDHLMVLASACAAIATVARNDEENLAVMTDQGVVMMLARLTCTTNETLRYRLTEAIAVCCWYCDNRQAFGKEGVVAPIVSFLDNTTNVDVQRSTARALHELSKYPDNCIVMHRAGAIRKLLPLISSSDGVMQEAAGCCIANVRRLSLANQRTVIKKPRNSSK